MFAKSPSHPTNPAPPSTPCLLCMSGQHDTCDPILAAIGIRERQRMAPGIGPLSISELKALVEHLDQFID